MFPFRSVACLVVLFNPHPPDRSERCSINSAIKQAKPATMKIGCNFTCPAGIADALGDYHTVYRVGYCADREDNLTRSLDAHHFFELFDKCLHL